MQILGFPAPYLRHPSNSSALPAPEWLYQAESTDGRVHSCSLSGHPLSSPPLCALEMLFEVTPPGGEG